MNAKAFHQYFILIAVLCSAFFVRLVARMAFGATYFWDNSYSFYYRLAQSVLSGKGFCLDTTTCVARPPLYPLFLTLSALAGDKYLLIVVPQALLGAGTALCAFLIGREIFNATVGLFACAITAFYPYYVMHDTALQETGLVTFCTALSVWLLLRASRQDRNRDWLLAGLALGSIALARASVAPAAGVGFLWSAIWGAKGSIWERLRKSSILLLATAVMVGPWLIRNYHLTGRFMLSSEIGHALWVGNNEETFSRYPSGSIDDSEVVALSKLTEADQAELGRLAGDEIATSDWFAHRAWEFIRVNPWLFVRSAFLKLEAAFSPQFNPSHDAITQWVYAISYIPVAVFGIIGLFLMRKRAETILIGMLFLAFMCVTAVFWAHTGHRSYLDVYLIVFAASAVEIFRQQLSRPHARHLGTSQSDSSGAALWPGGGVA